MTIGEIIQLARKKAGITQKELGERLGVSGSMIGQWENDLRKPKSETLEKISDALGKSFDDAALFLIEKSSAETKLKLEKLRLHQSIETELNDPSVEIETNLQNQITDFVRSTNGRTIIDVYCNWLNELGQTVAMERIIELSENPNYRRMKDK